MSMRSSGDLPLCYRLNIDSDAPTDVEGLLFYTKPGVNALHGNLW